MAGKVSSSGDRGRCSRCDASEMKDVHGDGKMHRWCNYYNNFCQRSAWNCVAPSDGYREDKN